MPFTLGAAVAALALCAEPSMASGNDKKSKPLKELMPWYHSGDEISSKISDLAGSCLAAGGEAEMSVGGANLDVVRVRGRRVSGDVAQTKVMLVFGEHARELITGESALGLMQSLCSPGTSASEMAQQALAQGVEFVLVPNANPKGRRLVEEGQYCKRTNENGVDLNRNWGNDHRVHSQESKGDEMNPGPEGFSEPETQALRDLVDQEKPDVFLSVHSGAYILGSAYGYKHGEANKAQVQEVLRPISEKYCNGGCPYGGVSDLLLYSMEGCDIDYVSEHSGVPYAFTWEIYAGPKTRPLFDMEAKDQQASGQSLAQRRVRHELVRGSSFLRGKASARNRVHAADAHLEADEDPQDCISEFLPPTEKETGQVVSTWAAAYLDLALRVAHKKAGSGASTITGTDSSVSQTADLATSAADDGSSQVQAPASTPAPLVADSSASQAVDLASSTADDRTSQVPALDSTPSPSVGDASAADDGIAQAQALASTPAPSVGDAPTGPGTSSSSEVQRMASIFR